MTIDGDTFYKCKSGAIAKLPPYYPQVGVLTNYIFYQHTPEEFVYLEKTDGERTLLLIDEDDIYKLSTYPTLSLTKLDNVPTNGQRSSDIYKLMRGFSLLDTELYNDKYYVFDAYAVDNVLVYNYDFKDRIQHIKTFLNKCHEANILTNIESKQIYNVSKENVNDIINMVNTSDYSEKTGHRIDGVVFQLVNMPYVDNTKKPSAITTFKLKRRTLNTIDFMVKYDADTDGRRPLANTKHVYYLYLQNKLFKCPYWYNLHKVDITKLINGWDTNGYNNEQIADINTLIADMANDPTKYNGAIIEMSLTYSNYWVPMRVRTDKQYSNSYKVGVSNMGVIFSPLTMDESYFTKDFSKSPFSIDLRSMYHDVNKVIRKYMFDVLFNQVANHSKLSLLDLCGGRGGDVKYYLPNNVSDIFVIDGDKQALVQYVERYYSKCNVNARYCVLDNDVDKTNKLIRQIQYYKQQFDIIVMNYAIHYLCDDDTKLVNLRKLISTLLRPGGYVLMSFFDGDKLIDNLPIKHFEGIKPCEDGVNCLMALPTIDPTGYRIEPLVRKHHIDLLTKSTDGEDTSKDSTDANNLRIVKEFYPLEDLLVNHKELFNDVAAYLVNIKTIILTH